MKNTLTQKELDTVKILIRLGDSEELAVETVILDRERQLMLSEQTEANVQFFY